MDKIIKKIEGFTRMRYMKVIMNAFMNVAALSIAGAIFSLVKSIPIPIWQTFLTNSGLGAVLSVPVSITSDLMAVFIVLSMGYSLAESFKVKPFAPAIIALGTFMILTPFTTNATIPLADGSTTTAAVSNVIPVGSLGAQGIFLAIFVGLLASRLYIALVQKGIKITMPPTVPPSVSQMFETMIPGGIVFILALAVRYVVGLTSFGTVQTLIYTVVQAPLVNVSGGLVGALIYVTAGKLLWMFGIHGDMVAYSAMASIMGTTMAANASAFAAGTAVPYLEWGLTTICQNVGILGLTILLLISKAKQHKSLGKLAITTSLFNITEPVMFGLPIIMNPIMAVPFILSPGISLLASYGVMKIGLVAPLTGASISNVLPVPLYFAFANANWTGFVWGLILIALNVALFFPFFKIAEKMACHDEAQEQAELDAEKAAE